MRKHAVRAIRRRLHIFEQRRHLACYVLNIRQGGGKLWLDVIQQLVDLSERGSEVGPVCLVYEIVGTRNQFRNVSPVLVIEEIVGPRHRRSQAVEVFVELGQS